MTPLVPHSAVPCAIFPTVIPGDVAEQPHNDLACALLNNHTSNNISNQYLGPISREPPFDAVHFDVPIAKGHSNSESVNP